MQEIARDIENVETVVAQANSLQLKLVGNQESNELITFLKQVMRDKEVKVPGGASGTVGTRITNMFSDAQKVSNNSFNLLCYIDYRLLRCTRQLAITLSFLVSIVFFFNFSFVYVTFRKVIFFIEFLEIT